MLVTIEMLGDSKWYVLNYMSGGILSNGFQTLLAAKQWAKGMGYAVQEYK